eukprot:m.240756 g.240756  ORF g.240756 m.240756 type:complete len:56 (+) comp15313_c0_seq12:1031-1198(+)
MSLLLQSVCKGQQPCSQSAMSLMVSKFQSHQKLNQIDIEVMQCSDLNNCDFAPPH